MKTKICPACKKELPLSEFHKTKHKKLGVVSRCKKCRKQYKYEYILHGKFNITMNEYNKMLEEQNGVCGICKKKIEDVSKRRKYLCVDHDHNSMKLRGLLCPQCNKAIGTIDENIDTLKNMISYIKEFNGGDN